MNWRVFYKIISKRVQLDGRLSVYLSTNNGTSWAAVNNGLPTVLIYAFIVSDTYLFLGTPDIGVWRRPLSEMITGTENPSNGIPLQFVLEQNYPNPFNPSTQIKYSIPQSSIVIIKVYDILGREIETLANEEKPVGTYEVTWNAANLPDGKAGLPSGVYFYRIKAWDFIQTKKMILLK